MKPATSGIQVEDVIFAGTVMAASITIGVSYYKWRQYKRSNRGYVVEP